MFVASEICRLKNEDLDEREQNLKAVLGKELKRLGPEGIPSKKSEKEETEPTHPESDIGQVGNE